MPEGQARPARTAPPDGTGDDPSAVQEPSPDRVWLGEEDIRRSFDPGATISRAMLVGRDPDRAFDPVRGA